MQLSKKVRSAKVSWEVFLRILWFPLEERPAFQRYVQFHTKGYFSSLLVNEMKILRGKFVIEKGKTEVP